MVSKILGEVALQSSPWNLTLQLFKHFHESSPGRGGTSLKGLTLDFIFGAPELQLNPFEVPQILETSSLVNLETRFCAGMGDGIKHRPCQALLFFSQEAQVR